MSKTKVIDAILFTDELDMLEIRMNELDSVVDYFVIVEALEAHGATKPRSACYAHNWDAPGLKKFRDRVIYEILPELKPAYTDGQSGWARENFHRNCLMSPVLQVAGPDDIVIVSDADEIPRAGAVRRYLSDPAPGIVLLRLDHYFYNVNCYGGIWMRNSIGALKDYQSMGGFQAPRGHLGDVIPRQVMALGNAGWHFSSFFSLPRLREKLATFAHSFEMGHLAGMSNEDLVAAIRARKNIFTGADLAKRPTRNPTLPAYFLEHLDRFTDLTEEGQKSGRFNDSCLSWA